MSQYTLDHNDVTYIYGFDGPMQQYFITRLDPEDGYWPLCGPLSDRYGNKIGFYEVLEEEDLLDVMPAYHRNQVALDLPF
jgi:hypothetical protein